MNTYANRGKALETLMRFANERYAAAGLACIEKQATEFIPLRNKRGQICGAKVERKSSVDFLGRYQHYPIAIEAKSSSTDTIRFDEIQTHQADFMDSYTSEPGTIGLVVVSFEGSRFFVIPWFFWSAAYDERVRKRSRTTLCRAVAHGQIWEAPKKYSVRADELNPLWEIPAYDMTYGIDYLKHAGEYIL